MNKDSKKRKSSSFFINIKFFKYTELGGCMNLSDLQRKDIVNVFDGKRLGRIIDASVTSSGVIEYFVVLERKFFQFWKSSNEITITFQQIKKIGTDVILVEL